jgi:excisionase family DNA binding protein
MQSPSDYLTVAEAAEYLRLSRSTLNGWRSKGIGPSYVKLGAAVRYVRADLDRWAEARRVGAA